MISEAERRTFLESSKLKLAAKARLAEGGGDARYEAAVLFHAAARVERRTLRAMDAPSPEARLASAIEVCNCLVDGLDPPAVLGAWGQVLDVSDLVQPPTARAMRARIDVKVQAMVTEYQRVLAKTPALRDWLDAGVPPSRARERDLGKMLTAFPGDAQGWGVRSAVLDGLGSIPEAWNAIRRARSLDPEDTFLRGWELQVMARHEPPDRAETVVDGVHAEILRGDTDADICFFFVTAALQLAEKSPHRPKLLAQALDAANAGFGALSPRAPERPLFRAMQLSLKELLAGRTPGTDILYRCGLGTLAAGNPSANPLAIVARARPIRRPSLAA
jgi:hypothetical protein